MEYNLNEKIPPHLNVKRDFFLFSPMVKGNATDPFFDDKM